jgi:hypothetical protein
MENLTGIAARMTDFQPTLTHSYYIGDLCYVMHDEWDQVCNMTPFDNQDGAEYELEDGRKFFFFSTAYGDGTYNDAEGRSYSVDSGSIGAIKVDDIRHPGFAQVVERGLGHIHEFPAEIDEWDCFVEGENGGVLNFGTVRIDTEGEDYEEEVEDDEDA